MSEDLPRQIGRYEVITLLGEGGMARVYLTVNHGPGGFNKLAVLKQILPQYASDANFVAMFLDEARLAARLHHPNIVQTFDVAEHGGNYVLAMEYLDGLALSSIYRRIHPKVIPLETHLWVLIQILSGLHYAHTLCDYDGTPLGVVHRDVNPANVLITFSGEVKLLDFGVAKARGALAVATERNIKGKPAYCAPEQLWGGEPDARADIFAVGVMLWEVLAGRRFNRSKSLSEAAKTRLSGKEPMIREVCPDIDPGLADICDRAMARNPEQRFATAAELGSELQAQLDKRNGNGRQILVEKLNEVFSEERRGLLKLIETCLADKSTRTLGAFTETQNSFERLLRSPTSAYASPTPTTPSKSHDLPVTPWSKSPVDLEKTPPLKSPANFGHASSSQSPAHLAQTPVAPVLPAPEQRLTPKPGLRIALGMAILAGLVLGGLLARSFWGKGQASQQPTFGTEPVQPPQGQTAAPEPTVTPPPVPETKPTSPTAIAAPAGTTGSPAASVATKPRVMPARFNPVRPNRKTALRPVQAPTARTEQPSLGGPPASDLVAAQPQASSSLPHSPKRRALPSETPASAQPGAHLVRPAVPAHSNVDEKDPYTP